MLSKILIVLFISSMFPGLVQSAVYKWVDDEGKVHYSQQRPVEHQSKKVHVATEPPKNTSTYKRPSLKTKDDKSAEGNQDKGNENGTQSQPSMSAKEKQQACDRARKVLGTLNSSGRVRQRDEEGNVTYLTEEEKQQRIKREQKRVNTYCK